MNEIRRITSAVVLDQGRLRLRFNDSLEKVVDVSPLLKGPVFEPLRDPLYFRLGKLDPICGTVIWPNGADFAPEALYALRAEHEVAS